MVLVIISQAKTIYQILRKNGYNIPIIISCGRRYIPSWEDIFQINVYQNELFYVSEEETNDWNFKAY